MKQLIKICATLMVAIPHISRAAEVTPEQAEAAAENWIKISPRRMTSRFGGEGAENTETARNKSGHAVFHAVNLKGGGFVITSGDTRLSPIVAFSDTGKYSDDAAPPPPCMRFSTEASPGP